MFYRVLICIALFLPITIYANDKEMKYGWQIPNTPLYLGGYLSVEHDPKKEYKLQFDDIALLFYGGLSKFDFLGEVEISHLPLSSKDIRSSDFRLHIERFQLDYDVSDDGVIRIGKFNSDIGYWNQTPINVLDDTTTSPNILENIFPKLTTGIMYLDNFDEGDKEFSITIQHNHDLDKKYNNILVDRHYGINYKSFEESFSWSMSSGYFRQLNKSEAYYAGVGIEKESDKLSILGELFSKYADKNLGIAYDGYLQTTWHILHSHDLVFRSEFYKDKALQVSENISVFGYTYRPKTSVAIKGEYVKHSVLPKSRFVFSFSMLF